MTIKPSSGSSNSNSNITSNNKATDLRDLQVAVVWWGVVLDTDQRMG